MLYEYLDINLQYTGFYYNINIYSVSNDYGKFTFSMNTFTEKKTSNWEES